MSKASLMVLMLAGTAQGFVGWHRRHIEFTTFADGRPDGGIRQSADVEDGLDSPGDIFVFDQKLLADDSCKSVIGRNAGYCIRTDPGKPDWSGKDHPSLPDDPENNWGQCTWTLTFYEESGYEGTLQVSGRESDMHTSYVSIIGGTGDFKGAKGVLATTPEPQTDNTGILFRQELDITLPKAGYSGWSGN